MRWRQPARPPRLTLIEPTGGISLDNFRYYLQQTCTEAGVPRVMPHVYETVVDRKPAIRAPETSFG